MLYNYEKRCLAKGKNWSIKSLITADNVTALIVEFAFFSIEVGLIDLPADLPHSLFRNERIIISDEFPIPYLEASYRLWLRRSVPRTSGEGRVMLTPYARPQLVAALGCEDAWVCVLIIPVVHWWAPHGRFHTMHILFIYIVLSFTEIVLFTFLF